MSNLGIKKGDTVMIISGDEKGKSGVVTAVHITDRAHKVTIDGLNEVSHFVKPRNAQEKGGIIKKSAPINISNVSLICPGCNKAARIGYKIVDGKKVRICAQCGAILDVAKTEAKKATKKAVKKTAAPTAADNADAEKPVKKTATKKAAVSTVAESADAEKPVKKAPAKKTVAKKTVETAE